MTNIIASGSITEEQYARFIAGVEARWANQDEDKNPYSRTSNEWCDWHAGYAGLNILIRVTNYENEIRDTR